MPLNSGNFSLVAGWFDMVNPLSVVLEVNAESFKYGLKFHF
jgi:hypothetical protein